MTRARFVQVMGAFLCAVSVHVGSGGAAGGPGVQSAAAPPKELASLDRALRGEDFGAYTLKKAVIRIEGTDPALGLKSGRGIEGGAEDAPAVNRNIYILQFGADGAGAEDLEVLKLQQETLENQLKMMRSVRDLADRHANLGARSARIENGARDMLAGMASSLSEEEVLSGESAETDSRASEIGKRTMDAAEKLGKMSKAVSAAAGAAKDLDMKMGKAARGMGGRGRARGSGSGGGGKSSVMACMGPCN